MSPQESIAHYRIVSKLGEGGMGAVYRATDTRLNRDVAIKVLPPAFAEDQARMVRFEREAQVLASLNHPNIAQIYGIEAGAIVMELVEGADLAGPLPLDTALDYARQIAAGLEAAHEKGVVHRDLKPANIKVTPDGTAKILDFGLAKTNESGSASAAISPTLSPTLSLEMTQAGMILGTAAYMSPEQARGKATDKRADIWAFGVVLYEMITGRRPFEGEDISQMMAAVILKEPNLDGIPASLHRLLKSCLEKDPKKRLRDIGDVWRLLGEDSPPPAPAAPAPAARSRLALVTMVVAALALMAAGGLGFVHFREQPPATAVMRSSIPFSNEAVGSAAISPDGRQIVAATNVIGQASHLMLRSLDTLEMRVLPGTQAANQPFWSPDSRHIAFAAVNQLKVVDLHGGPPQDLADVSTFRGGTWSSSGDILYASDAKLYKIRFSGGTPTNVPTGSLPAIAPAFLPDGRHFFFTSSIEAGHGGIHLGSVDSRDPESRQPRRILPDVSRAMAVGSADPQGAAPDHFTVLFVRGTTLMGVAFDGRELRTSGDVFPIAERIGREMATASEKFGVSNTGILIYLPQETLNRKLTWYDRQGKVLGTVNEPGSYHSVAVSPDGTQLAVDRDIGGNYDIWLYDLVRNSVIRLTSDPAQEQSPVWSPDGKWVAYNSIRDNVQRLYRKAANGTGAEELLGSGNVFHLYDWSLDGKYLLVAYPPAPGSLRDLYAVPAEGAHKPIPLVQTNFRDDQGHFSPDGKFVAYKSNETGRDEIHVQPALEGTGSERWVISHGGGTMPRWSRDGKELFFIAAGKLMVAPVQTSPSFHAGVPQEMFSTQIAGKGGNAYVPWDVTPDGKKFIVITEDTAPQEPLTVVVNWPLGLRR